MDIINFIYIIIGVIDMLDIWNIIDSIEINYIIRINSIIIHIIC
jgi:hypothetical protein